MKKQRIDQKYNGERPTWDEVLASLASDNEKKFKSTYTRYMKYSQPYKQGWLSDLQIAVNAQNSWQFAQDNKGLMSISEYKSVTKSINKTLIDREHSILNIEDYEHSCQLKKRAYYKNKLEESHKDLIEYNENAKRSYLQERISFFQKKSPNWFLTRVNTPPSYDVPEPSERLRIRYGLISGRQLPNETDEQYFIRVHGKKNGVKIYNEYLQRLRRSSYQWHENLIKERQMDLSVHGVAHLSHKDVLKRYREALAHATSKQRDAIEALIQKKPLTEEQVENLQKLYNSKNKVSKALPSLSKKQLDQMERDAKLRATQSPSQRQKIHEKQINRQQINRQQINRQQINRQQIQERKPIAKLELDLGQGFWANSNITAFKKQYKNFKPNDKEYVEVVIKTSDGGKVTHHLTDDPFTFVQLNTFLKNESDFVRERNIAENKASRQETSWRIRDLFSGINDTIKNLPELSRSIIPSINRLHLKKTVESRDIGDRHKSEEELFKQRFARTLNREVHHISEYEKNRRTQVAWDHAAMWPKVRFMAYYIAEYITGTSKKEDLNFLEDAIGKKWKGLYDTIRKEDYKAHLLGSNKHAQYKAQYLRDNAKKELDNLENFLEKARADLRKRGAITPSDKMEDEHQKAYIRSRELLPLTIHQVPVLLHKTINDVRTNAVNLWKGLVKADRIMHPHKLVSNSRDMDNEVWDRRDSHGEWFFFDSKEHIYLGDDYNKALTTGFQYYGYFTKINVIPPDYIYNAVEAGTKEFLAYREAWIRERSQYYIALEKRSGQRTYIDDPRLQAIREFQTHVDKGDLYPIPINMKTFVDTFVKINKVYGLQKGRGEWYRQALKDLHLLDKHFGSKSTVDRDALRAARPSITPWSKFFAKGDPNLINQRNRVERRIMPPSLIKERDTFIDEWARKTHKNDLLERHRWEKSWVETQYRARWINVTVSNLRKTYKATAEAKYKRERKIIEDFIKSLTQGKMSISDKARVVELRRSLMRLKRDPVQEGKLQNLAEKEWAERYKDGKGDDPFTVPVFPGFEHTIDFKGRGNYPQKRDTTIVNSKKVEDYSRPIIVFDIETGYNNEILSLVAAKFVMDKNTRKLKHLATYERYYLPTQENLELVQSVHGLSRKVLKRLRKWQAKSGLKYRKHYDDTEMFAFREFIGENALLVGHNSNEFDIKHALKGHLGSCDTFDTLVMARNLRPRDPTNILVGINKETGKLILDPSRIANDLDTAFKVATKMTMEEAGLSHHDAGADVLATAVILQTFLNSGGYVGEASRFIANNPGMSLYYAERPDNWGVSAVIHTQGLQDEYNMIKYYVSRHDILPYERQRKMVINPNDINDDELSIQDVDTTGDMNIDLSGVIDSLSAIGSSFKQITSTLQPIAQTLTVVVDSLSQVNGFSEIKNRNATLRSMAMMAKYVPEDTDEFFNNPDSPFNVIADTLGIGAFTHMQLEDWAQQKGIDLNPSFQDWAAEQKIDIKTLTKKERKIAEDNYNKYKDETRLNTQADLEAAKQVRMDTFMGSQAEAARQKMAAEKKARDNIAKGIDKEYLVAETAYKSGQIGPEGWQSLQDMKASLAASPDEYAVDKLHQELKFQMNEQKDLNKYKMQEALGKIPEGTTEKLMNLNPQDRVDAYIEAVKSMKELAESADNVSDKFGTLTSAIAEYTPGKSRFYDPRITTQAAEKGYMGAFGAADFLPRSFQKNLLRLGDAGFRQLNIKQSAFGTWLDIAHESGLGMQDTMKKVGGFAGGQIGGALGESVGGPLGKEAGKKKGKESGGAFGNAIGWGINFTSQVRGRLQKRQVENAFSNMQSTFDLMSVAKDYLIAPFKLISAAVKSLTGLFKNLGVSLVNFMNGAIKNMGGLGTPLTTMTGIGYSQYQGLGAMDNFFGFGAGTLNGAFESTAMQAQMLYTSGQFNNDRLVASARLGVFDETYGTNASFDRIVNGLMSQPVTKERMALAGQIDSSLPAIMQVMSDIGVTNWDDFKNPSNYYNKKTKQTIGWHAINDEERSDFRRTYYEYSAIQQNIGNTKMRAGQWLWANGGGAIMNGVNEALDLIVSKGDWKGAWEKLKTPIMDVWKRIKTYFGVAFSDTDTLWTKIKKFGEAVWDKISDAINPNQEGGEKKGFVDTMKDVFDSIIQAIFPVMAKGAIMIEELWNSAFKTIIREAAPILDNFFDMMNRVQVDPIALLPDWAVDNFFGGREKHSQFISIKDREVDFLKKGTPLSYYDSMKRSMDYVDYVGMTPEDYVKQNFFNAYDSFQEALGFAKQEMAEYPNTEGNTLNYDQLMQHGYVVTDTNGNNYHLDYIEGESKEAFYKRADALGYAKQLKEVVYPEDHLFSERMEPSFELLGDHITGGFEQAIADLGERFGITVYVETYIDEKGNVRKTVSTAVDKKGREVGVDASSSAQHAMLPAQ